MVDERQRNQTMGLAASLQSFVMCGFSYITTFVVDMSANRTANAEPRQSHHSPDHKISAHPASSLAMSR
ncbi:hypothetical protein BDQ12DRAFT_686321 [Crucibulum laeve]|uniref:Uncharacterized protein n=1 Tax=Crucibulum laeve TaxID=68775 RepID=A0A5C3LVV1_9AGAR|nr:hypothetical protein BDQ12DRAFT_686321 [Crucibulum laeve]